ncbi:MAG: hypothetical protein VW338_18420, partial [Rhodospirillaceae bacterium]
MVEQDTAAGLLAAGAPGRLAPGDQLGLAVGALQVDDLAELARLDDTERVLHRVVVAVVETVLQHLAGA